MCLLYLFFSSFSVYVKNFDPFMNYIRGFWEWQVQKVLTRITHETEPKFNLEFVSRSNPPKKL